MASRFKEDEKNERIIRGLLKQPGNRKCINCNALGPQYVCITFSTFVCTTCSGIHREFTHRVKSVSMAKFSPQEIAALQAGGNEHAKEIFFKEWESQHPNSSNVDKLRNFIKHVYVDRKYTGERSTDRPQQGDKDIPKETRRSESYGSASRSPPYDDERRYSDRPSPGHDVRSSPGYVEDNRRHSDYGRSPVRSGIVSDWRREDRFSNGRMSDDRRSSDGEFKPEIRSPDSQSNSTISSPPAVRPVRDILGENVIPLRISEPPRTNSTRVAEGVAITQRTVSSSSLASSNGNPTELKSVTSLIDFNASSEPVAPTQVQESAVAQSVAQPTSAPSDDNWACFDSFTENNVSQTPPPTTNTLESMLSELSFPAPAPAPAPAPSLTPASAPAPSLTSAPASAPAPAPAPVSGLTNGSVTSPPSFDFFSSDSGDSNPTTAVPGASSLSTLSSFPSGGMTAGHGLAPTMPANNGAQWHGMQNPRQPSAVSVNQPSASQLVSGYPNGLSTQGVVRNPVAQPSHAFTQAPQAAPAPIVQTAEVDASRKALPADLFTTTYSPIPYQGPGWQTGPVHGMRYPMQHNAGMSMPTFHQPIQSANPFDVNAGASPSQPQASTFPSMSSLHTALPNMAAPGGSMHPSNLGGARPSWMPPQQSSYPSAIPPHGSSFASPLPGAYMGQQVYSNIPPSRPQGFGNFGNEGPSVGGNPFD